MPGVINGTTTARLGNRLCTSWVAALALGAGLALAGCSTAVSGQAAPAPAAAPPTSAPAATRPPATPTADPDQGDPQGQLDAAAEQLRPYLLEADDIGPGFTVGTEPQPDPSTPAICGGPGVVAQFPVAARVGVAFDGPTPGVLVQETVSIYGDVATAEQAYQANLDGLDCSQGSLSGQDVVLTPAEDLSVDVPAEQSTGWRIGGTDFDAILIASRNGELVMNFVFLTPVDQAADLPDPLAISRTGVEKFGG
jgi:hypothetical protein